MDSADLERRLTRYFADQGEGIAAVYLFGSFARGTAGRDSDVDVGVLFDCGDASVLDSRRTRLEGDLERRLGLTVDVVDLERAPVDLAIRVLRAERLLLDRDPSRRIAFEVRTRNVFFDLEPHLRRYRRMEPTR